MVDSTRCRDTAIMAARTPSTDAEQHADHGQLEVIQQALERSPRREK